MQIYTPDQLNDLMSESDYIVVALPHTDKTEKLVNAAAINSMKRTGVFVNIGRGQTVDEEALVKGTICSPLCTHLTKLCMHQHVLMSMMQVCVQRLCVQRGAENTDPSQCGQGYKHICCLSFCDDSYDCHFAMHVSCRTQSLGSIC